MKKNIIVAVTYLITAILCSTIVAAYNIKNNEIESDTEIIRIEAPETFYDYAVVSFRYEKEQKQDTETTMATESAQILTAETELVVSFETLHSVAALSANAELSIENNIVDTEKEITEETTIEIEAPDIVKEIDNIVIDQYIYYDIPLSDELQEFTQKACKYYNINIEVVYAIMWSESRYVPDVISHTNDYGIMQINTCNHEDYKNILGITDFLDAKQGIVCGIYMLWDLKTNYRCTTDDLMIMGYPGIGLAWEKWEQGIYTSPYVVKIKNRMNTLEIR